MLRPIAVPLPPVLIMLRLIVPVLVLAGIAGTALPAGAQLSAIAPGDRVRATLQGSTQAQEYTVVAVRTDTLQVRQPASAEDQLLPLSIVQRLEVYRGREPRSTALVRRAGYGAAIGALAGGVLLAVIDDDGFFADSRAGSFVAGALVGGAVGGALGAVGSLAPGRERWEAVVLR
jgi:hypothetical protein